MTTGLDDVYINSIDLIVMGVQWLSDKIQYRDDYEQPDKTNSYAVQYAKNQAKVINRIKEYIEEGEDNLILLLEKLLNLEIHPDVAETLAIIAANRKTFEDFSEEEVLLLSKIVFGKQTKWQTCRFCFYNVYWQNPHGQWLCARCHPRLDL